MLTIVERIELARRMSEQLGPDAARILEQRARVHAEEGDRDAADFWRDIACALRELSAIENQAAGHAASGWIA